MKIRTLRIEVFIDETDFAFMRKFYKESQIRERLKAGGTRWFYDELSSRQIEFKAASKKADAPECDS